MYTCIPAAARAAEADESTDGGAEDGPTLENATGALKGQPPNKRLKLAGALVLKESLWVVPWRARDVRPLPLRRRADRPQLKRDPLGGTRTAIASPSPFREPYSRLKRAVIISIMRTPAPQPHRVRLRSC